MRQSKYDHAVNKYHHRFMDDKFRKLNVTRPESYFLKRIYKCGGKIPMNDIVGDMGFHKSHATRAISKLVNDGLVIKETNLEDKRAYNLSLTEKGRTLAKSVKAVFEEWDELVDTVITDEEKEMFANISKKLYHLLREYYGEEDNIND